MTNEQSNVDGTFSADELVWLDMRARGGFGALISAAAHVRSDGQSYKGQIAAFSDLHVEGLAKFAASAKAQGALGILQLVHGGLRSNALLTGKQPVAPSAVDLPFPDYVRPRTLGSHEIRELADDFASAALRAQRAGLDGIEIHAANGYLFTQFLSSVTNLRVDEWGGSLENRTRFLITVIDAIRGVVNREFIVGVRLRAEDFPAQRGFDIDETVAVISILNEHDISYVHLAAANVLDRSWSHPHDNTTNVRRIRSALKTEISLVVNGAVTTVVDAEAALAEGADFVAIGKAAISTPDLPLKIAEPGFRARAFPMTRVELKRVGVTEPFADYLRSFNLVAD